MDVLSGEIMLHMAAGKTLSPFSLSTLIYMHINFGLLLLCVSSHRVGSVLWCVCGGQRTTLWSRLLPFSPGIELGVSAILYPLSHPTTPVLQF